MIRLDVYEGQRQVGQASIPPLVYLDHAPMMDVAQFHGKRFSNALLKAGGTLAFSWVNLVEISEVSPETGAMVQSLIERVWPHVISSMPNSVP